MPSRITKTLKIQVGTYANATGRELAEYREVGVMIEHEKNGNTWQEIKLHADLLPSVLYLLAKPFMQKGSGSVRVKLFDLTRRAGVKEEEGDGPARDAEWDGDDGRYDSEP